jgi:hypothetical protein
MIPGISDRILMRSAGYYIPPNPYWFTPWQTYAESMSFGTLSQPKIAQSFYLNGNGSWNMEKTAFKLRKIGSPGGYCYVSLYDDNNGQPGNEITWARISNPYLSSTGFYIKSFVFSPYPVIQGKTRYWLVFSISYLSNSNYVSLQWKSWIDSVDGGISRYDGSNWNYYTDDDMCGYISWNI